MIKSWEDRAARGTIRRAVISAATTGDHTIVAAAADGIKTKVLFVHLVAAGAVAARFESGAGGMALTGVMTMATGIPFTTGPTMPGYHLFETAANTLLNLEISDQVQVSGLIVFYQEE